MKLFSLALALLFLATLTAHGQSVARSNRLAKSDSLIAETEVNDRVLAARAILLLSRLDRDVLVFRSLGVFEADGRLARVSFEDFQKDYVEISAEVEPILSRLPQGRLKTDISNALDSYRDGAFWWQKIDQPRVVHVSALATTETSRTSSDLAFLATVPYTVAIHWRQANEYLKHAEGMMNGSRK
ncbi:MAG: hypothetical protein ACMG6H_11355 [Acidobacteriota bacterium]